jgi:hypothetical protein
VRARNKEQENERARKYRAENRELLRDKARAYRIKNFERDREKRKLAAKKYREKSREKRRAYLSQDHIRVKTRQHTRRAQLKRLYGITPEQRDAMFESQGSCCILCGSIEPRGGKWAVDHCHTNGKIRGVACNSCNTALGLFMDSSTLLRKAADYLDKHKDIR